jgi:Rrf2 family cysteine metabolism transcriptional repressor
VRGPNGGYELARKPSSVTALDVISSLEGKCAPVDCVLESSACSRAAGCAARGVWSKVAAAVDRVLASVTLDHLAARRVGK